LSVRFQSVAESARRRVLEVGRTGGLAEQVALELGVSAVETAGAFDELPFPPRSFDCVVAAPNLSDAAARELRRVLYEDGSLLAVAPQSQWFLLRHFTVIERRGDVFVCTP
jgi:SAM-dependent methyltransferase